MPVAFATLADIDSHIADRVNAATAWGGAIVSKMRTAGAITNARRQAAYEILRAISRNLNGPYFGVLAEWVAVTNGELFQSDGAVGIPRIVPFDGATARKGFPADPDDVDSYRASPELFTGALDGEAVAHNEADTSARMSPLACLYSFYNSVITFTGFSCEVPVMLITEAMADEKMPLALVSANVKLALPKLVKPGDDLFQVARQDAIDGRDDLLAIEVGAMSVRPPRAVPEVVTAQKQLI